MCVSYLSRGEGGGDTLASLNLISASCARMSASAAFSATARISSSCFFWYSGARLRVSRSCSSAPVLGLRTRVTLQAEGFEESVAGMEATKYLVLAKGSGHQHSR